MADNDSTKAAVLKLLKRGLVTKSEASRLAGVSRQLMQSWAKDIPIDEAREAVLARLWKRAHGDKSG